jgi:hypothetical protein
MLASCHCLEILEIINLKRRFGEFSPWMFGSSAFGPMEGQNIMVEYVVEQSCLPHGGQEKKQESKEGARVSIFPFFCDTAIPLRALCLLGRYSVT